MKDFSDTPVAAFNHPIGLLVPGFDEAVQDVMNRARFIKGMLSCWLPFTVDTETISKFLAVVGKDCIDGKRCLVKQAVEIFISGLSRRVVMDFNINPAD